MYVESNKRYITGFPLSQPPLKKVKVEEPAEIPFLTVRECVAAVAKTNLNGDLADLSVDALLAAVRSRGIPFSERIVRFESLATESSGFKEMWLQLEGGKSVYIRLHKHFHNSFLARESSESQDISIYTEEQEEKAFQDEGLDINMHKPHLPLLSLKFDAETCEVVWLQGAPGFNGRDLKKITEVFTNLFSPKKVFLADQAIKNGRLLRQYYPLIKPAEDISLGPGYYGSWGFVPANLWRVKPSDGDGVTQSRDLYYSAVKYLRSLTVEHLNTVLQRKSSKDHFSQLTERYGLKTDATFHQLMKIVFDKMAVEEDRQATKDFSWIFHYFLKPYSPRLKKSNNTRLFELALQVLVRTEVWEKAESGRFYRDFLMSSNESFFSLVGNASAYSRLVQQVLNIKDYNQAEWRE